MRFRFCGNLNCPDWILAEVALLSKLTSLKFRLLCQQVCTGIIENHVDTKIPQQILGDIGLDVAQIKGCLAALLFIFQSSSKYECRSADVSHELEQLGLPAELAQQFNKIYEANSVKIRDTLRKRSFMLPSIAESQLSSLQGSDGNALARLDVSLNDNNRSSFHLQEALELMQRLEPQTTSSN